jgi:hypothetical protein
MNNEKMNQIIDDAYNSYLKHTIIGVNTGLDRVKGYLNSCLVEYDGYYEHFTNPSFQYGYRPHTKEEFINKCKTDTEFSEKWGLKIEESELSRKERSDYYYKNGNKEGIVEGSLDRPIWEDNEFAHKWYDERNVPTKLITITYNGTKIESYE